MTVTGISLQEITSGGASAPQGQEFKQAYFAEHPTMTGMHVIDISTSIATTFAGSASLIAELETAQANGNSNFWAVVYLVAPGQLIAANLAAQIADLAANHQVSTLFFLTSADLAFADALGTALAAQEAQKQYFEAVIRYRKAYNVAQTGTADFTTVPTELTLTLGVGHDLQVGQTVEIHGTNPFAGVHTIASVNAGAGTIGITLSSVAHTWGAGDQVEETPTSYAANFKAEFLTFASSSVAIVAPTTQDKWMGAIGGRLARIPVQSSLGKVLDGSMVGVATDVRYGHSQFVVLDEGRGLFLKRFVEDPSAVYVNDDLVMHSVTDTITTLAQRRVVNKAKRGILFYAFPLINSNQFNKDASGALAAAQIAARGLEEMKKPVPGKSRELFDYSLSTAWITGGISILFTLTDVNRIKVVDSSIELINQI